MKHILVPTDFSDQSWRAALCAINLYKNAGMRFYIFFSEEHDYLTDDCDLDTITASRKLTVLIKKLKKHIRPGQVLTPLKWESDFIGDIRAAVSDNKIDLIVTSTHYPNIFYNGLKGSHVRDIVTRIKCPVLIVPRAIKCTPPRQVALLTDYNNKPRSQATDTVHEFIHRSQAHLNILQLAKTDLALSPTQQLNKEYLKTALDDTSHSFHFVIDKTIDEALQFFINVQQVDLVILFAKNRNLSENLLFAPSLDKNINYHENTPFLIIHE